MIVNYLIGLLISIIAGFINTLAGSGSLLLLPMLIFMGISPKVANGTIRPSVFFQSMVALKTLSRNNKISIKETKYSTIPCILGAFLGAYLALIIDNSTMKQFIGILMIIMLIVILFNPKKWLKKVNVENKRDKTWWGMIIMFVIGIYGGFVQGGAGVFMLATLVLLMGYSMQNANIIKLLVIFLYAFPVMLIFAFQGQIEWAMAIILIVGQGIGAYLGAIFAIRFPKAELYTYRLLIFVICVAIIQFYELWYWIKFW